MTKKQLGLVISVLSALLLLSVTVASKADRNTEQNVRQERKFKQNERRDSPYSANYRLDKKHFHDRYYPRRGHIVGSLSKRRFRILYRDRSYFYWSGIWYRSRGPKFEVIAPPIGIVVPILPSIYSTVWVRSVPYYYANWNYYVWRPDRNGYEVVEPPADIDQASPLVADELFVYPKQGQSEQQQADDRYDCHRQSREKTGYDPSAPLLQQSMEELNRQRERYQRSMKACLEALGYSVG